MKGQWCNYNKAIFCQESAGCSGCEIYLCRDSNSQETNKNAVLQSIISPNLPFSSDTLQTQAGVTYPIPPKTPAFNIIRYSGCGSAMNAVSNFRSTTTQQTIVWFASDKTNRRKKEGMISRQIIKPLW